MNSMMREYYPTFEMYQALREQLMEILTDEDLAFQPGGENVTLGELCREIGEAETSYIESFKTFTQDFSYRNEEPGLDRSVDRLVAWYKQLDQELKATIEALTEKDLQNRVVDRGGGFVLPLHIQLDVYKEALLIFYGKASVYLKALGKSRPEQWQEWIG
ncbi:MAG: DinB family protein [Anaerolineaceae bacterium]|nr:MAG: DinB family protein [Anaerolineaceae bacterium]